MRVRRSRARPPCYHSWIAMRRYCGHVGGATPYQLSHYVSVSVCREWLDYGRVRGIGQWRNSGKGRFTWEEIRCY